MYADKKDFKIYIFFEYIKTNMTTQQIADMLISNGFDDEVQIFKK